ncbi:hypothetical protein [Candidatus Thiodiazotropha sp. CDECU1]|uniref:hypothetical protein n=1 Tax=Candidatus Thiodiazotropha sp. CDECU1 TaxID=3065865 RepID=UPI00292DD3DF|nr:hypothetical protein [Candidatus Thiodiazotropha sp. CDECU1]
MFHILKSIHLLLFCCYLSACGSGSNPDTEAPAAVSNVINTTTFQSVTLTWNAAHERGLTVALKKDLDQISELIDYSE